jgi:hypothetical protein
MGLQEKLKEHKTKFEKHAKPEILEVMRRAKRRISYLIV